MQQLLAQRPSSVGLYRLVIKEGSDNIRSSAVLGILHRLLEAGVGIVIYEPLLTDRTYRGAPLITELADFKASSDLIVANRIDNQLDDVSHKLFSRDLFGSG